MGDKVLAFLGDLAYATHDHNLATLGWLGGLLALNISAGIFRVISKIYSLLSPLDDQMTGWWNLQTGWYIKWNTVQTSSYLNSVVFILKSYEIVAKQNKTPQHPHNIYVRTTSKTCLEKLRETQKNSSSLYVPRSINSLYWGWSSHL